jgi:transcriptional regulator with XRE-family HTH domain
VTITGDQGGDAPPALRIRSGPQAAPGAPSRATRKRRAGAEDLEIGRKIRALRLQRGLSQSSLAEGIGLTFQQVQKYEKGTNRVSAGRLQRIADLLDTPITFFYRGAGAPTRKSETRNSGLALIQTKGAMRLLRSYADISSRTTKYALVVLAESLRNKERG